MPTKTKDYKFNTIYAALIFLVLGLFVSPTVVSLYHILIIIPTLILIKQGSRFKLPNSAKALLLLFSWGLLSTAINYNELIKPFKAFQELKYYLLGVLCIFPLRYFFDKAQDKHLKVLLHIFYFTLIAAFIVGFTKAYLGFDIIAWERGEFFYRSGGFLNYMRYGYGSALVFILGLGVFISSQRFRSLNNPKVFFLVMLVNILAIFAAKTRGAILAVIVGVPILIARYRPKIAIGLVSIGAIFIAIVLYISFFGSTNSRLLKINDGSNKKRLSQFYSAVKSIQEKPVIGLGADQFSYHVTDLKNRYDIWSKEYSGHSHNIFLEHAANYGIIGLLIFAAFLIFWIVELFKNATNTSWAVISYVIAFTTAGQVELLFDNLNSHLFFFVYSSSQVFLLARHAKSSKTA